MPKKKEPGYRKFGRWTWRLTYISVLGGLAYGAYGLHVLRHPNDQEPPDPSKKTLVVLGMTLPICARKHGELTACD
jgi:NADH:ubiquinone reductase (non-electrogenic)